MATQLLVGILMSQNKSFFVTIYTDASHCPDTKRAVWAFYARCSDGVIKEHGECKGTVNCSTSAEMYAIYEAVKMCKAEWPELEGFFINTDSLTSCKMLWPDNLAKTDHYKIPQAQRIKRYIEGDMKQWGTWSRVKHVKAHTGQNDIRSWLNRWCDKRAIKNLRALREKENVGSESRVIS